MFFRTPFFLPYLYSSLTWRIPVEEKIIYLTFDDGPVPGPTEFVLDTLQQFDVRATFFCIGDNARKHPALLQKISEGGHAIGNHTFNHMKGWSVSKDKYVDNVALCDQQLHQILALPAPGPGSRKLFRPPYGRIRRNQITALADYHIIMWDVLTSDYDKHLNPDRCLKGSISATRPGSVVVFHDSIKAEKNMTYVLPKYIAHFLEQGYTFDVIPNSL